MNDQRNGTNGFGAHTNGNGHNGHDQKSGIVAKEDPLLSTVVPNARKRIATNNKLTFGARNYFQWATDQSLTFGSYIRRGVFKISDHDAGIRFKVDARTVRNWKRELEPTGEIWFTEKWMKNSFPQTVYNITAIVGQANLPLNADSDDGSLADDEIFSSNRRRQQSARRNAGSGMFVCRAHGQSGCELCRQHRTPPRVPATLTAPETLQNSAENDTVGNFLPPTTEKINRPPRKGFSAHHGKNLPPPTEAICRDARKEFSAVDGKDLPLSTEKRFRGERKQFADKGKTRDIDLGSKESLGGAQPPSFEVEEAIKEGDTLFGDWCLQWKPDDYRSKWEKELRRIKMKLMNGSSPFWQRRADYLQTKLDGGKPPVTKAGPVRGVKTGKLSKPDRMPFEQRQALAAKHFKKLSPSPVAAGT